MTGRPRPGPSEPGRALPVLDRLAPAPPQSLVVSLIDGHTADGDIVADLFGRGGWVARAGLDRQRRVVSLESSPLTRMLAEVVLRPPDVRHLDAAFQGIAASPRRESSLKVSLGDMFATRCATCGRTLVVDEIVWQPRTTASRRAPSPSATAARSAATSAAAGSSARRSSTPTTSSGPRPTSGPPRSAASSRDRFPPIDGAPDLVDELLDLHSPRQLVGLAAIIARVEGDLRAAPVARRAPSGGPPRDPAGQPPDDGPGRTARCASRRARPLAGPRHLAGAQPVGRVRGRLPAGPRLRAGTRGRSARAGPGAARRGPAQPRGGDRDRAARPRRRRRRPGARDWTAGTRVAAAARAIRLVLGQPPLRPAWTGWRPRTTGRRGCSGARRVAAARPRRWRVPRCGRRGAGRPRRSAEPLEADRAAWPATAASCCWSTAVRRRSSRPSSAALGRAPPRDAPSSPTPTTTSPPGRAAPRRAPSLPPRSADPRERRPCAPSPAAPAIPTSSPVRACSRRPSGSTRARSRRARQRAGPRDRRRDAQGARRAGPLRAPPRRGPRRTRSRRAAPALHRRGRERGRRGGRTRAGTRRSAKPVSAGDRRDRPSATDGQRAADRVTEPGRRTAPVAHGAQTAGDAAPDPVERLLALIGGELARPTPAPPGRDRARPLVARRSGGPRSGRRAARRSRRMGRFSLLSTAGPMPEAAFFERIAAHVHRARPARRDARPRLPRQLPQPRQHARTGSSPTMTCCSAARSTPSCSPRSPTAATGSGCGSGSGAASRRAGSMRAALRRPASATASVTVSLSARWVAPKSCRGRLHLVRPRQGRVPVRGRVDRDARRAPAAPPRAHPAPTSGSCGSSSSPRSAPSSSATSWPARPCCGRRWTTPLAHPQVRPSATVPRARRARPRRARAVPRPRSARRTKRRAAAAVRGLRRRATDARPAVPYDSLTRDPAVPLRRSPAT